MARYWKLGLALIFTLAVIAASAWWQREPILCWYSLRGLDQATGADRAIWVAAVVERGELAVPGLLERWRREDARVCKNAQAALTALALHWGDNDPRALHVAHEVAAGFDGYSVAGKSAALKWQALVAGKFKSPAPRMRRLTAQMLGKAIQRLEPDIRRQALSLAAVAIAEKPAEDCLTACAELIRGELKNPNATLRAEAVRLTIHAVFKDHRDLLKQVAPLLKDKDVNVRRAALLAVGSARPVIADEELLPLLHDKNAEVRRLCEAALQSRGLTDDHIVLGRLISDSRPAARLQIIHHLPFVEDIEPSIWIQRLSRDSSAAVRAAAIRLSLSYPKVHFQSRLHHMARTDPSATVRQLARFYSGKR